MSIDELKNNIISGKKTVLLVRVRPGAATTKISGFLSDGSIKIAIKAVPEDGKANQELLDYLSEIFGVKRTSITILSGARGRLKTVQIEAGDL